MNIAHADSNRLFVKSGFTFNKVSSNTAFEVNSGWVNIKLDSFRENNYQ